jgi:hypothetical protein
MSEILVTYYQPYLQKCHVWTCNNMFMSYDTGCLCDECHDFDRRNEGRFFFEKIGGKDNWENISREEEDCAFAYAREMSSRMLFHRALMLHGAGL